MNPARATSPDRARALSPEAAARAVPNSPNRFHRALHIGAQDTPAEMLDPFDRRLLLMRLRHRPIADIAAHTGWSEYTVTRLLDDIGVPTLRAS